MIRLDIDVTLEQLGAAPGTEPFLATVVAAGQDVVVTVNDSSRLPRGGRRMLTQLIPLAEGLARRGVSVAVKGPKGVIMSFGAVKVSALQKLVTGSPHIAVGGRAALASTWATLRKRSAADTLTPPPSTLFPLVPSIARTVTRRITTTHYLPGSGRPRLIFAVGSGYWDGSRPREFDLLPDRTLIGSSPDADLRLEGLAPIQAEIRHDRDDEYVLHTSHVAGGSREMEPRGSSGGTRVLRTGSHIELGRWRLAFYREEFADHGRPFGGRQGGELAIQRPQPSRSYPERTGHGGVHES